MNPYPLYLADQYTYQAAQNHSVMVDQWLGFNTSNIENDLRRSEISQIHQTWSELSPQSFQTPYCELRSLLGELDTSNLTQIIDLGSAYSRLAFIIGRHYPHIQFTGYEVAIERVSETIRCLRNWKYQNVKVIHQNLMDPGFQLPHADLYFLYDFGHNKDIQKILEQLKILSQKRPIQVVARGRASRHFIFNENPWLTLTPPRNYQHYTIFKSA